jgi:formamidopyrimidine-DNA glycosylase
MPELPEVETTRQGILPYCVDQTIKNIYIRETRLRWPIPEDLPQKLVGQKILHIARRSKYLLWQFSQGLLLMHLGMSGVIRVLSTALPAKKHDHVDIELASGVTIRFTDPRRFGAILWTDTLEHRLLKALGPEPLTPEFNAQYFQQALKRTTRPIKLAIMDAKLVVGVGNIYANEALFLSRIHPQRLANSLNNNEVESLVHHIKATLTKAIQAGGTTLKDFLQSDGRPGYFRQELLVYGKKGQPCSNCSQPLEEIRLNNRSTIFCKQCQQ